MPLAPLRLLVRWSPACLLLVGLLLVPTAVQAQVEIDGIVKDYSDLNPGDTGTATVTIENVGASMVDAFLTLDVPTDVIELDEVTPSAGSCTQDGTDTVHVDCTFNDLASDSTREVDVVMTATDSLGGSLIDVASGRQGQAEPDDEALISVTVLSPGEADLALDCTTEADTLTVGAEVTYACTVTNTTSTDSAGAKKIKEKALDLKVSAYASDGNAEFTSATTETGECTVGQNALCSREMLDEGEVWPFDVTVIWQDPGPTTLKSGVSANTEDPNLGNNNDQVNRTAVEQTSSADLKVEFTDDGPPAAGGLFLLEAILGNNGPDAAGTAELTIDLPGDVLTPITVEVPSGGEGTDCKTESSGDTKVTCIMTDMKSQEERRVAVDTKVASDRGGTDVTSAASTQPGGGTSDPDGGNNNDEVTHTVEETPVADLTISKGATKRPLEAENLSRIKLPFVVPGDTVDFSIKVKNEGSAPATGVKLFDNPPLSTLADLGPAFEIVWDQIDSDCADAFAPSGTGARLIDCELGEIAPGDSVLVIIPMTVHDEVKDQVVNGVEVWSQTPEENTQNNTDEYTMRAVDGRLRVRKEEVIPVEAPELLNSEVEYKIEVENTSSITAENVEMTDALPDELDVIPSSIDHSFEECSVTNAKIVCNRATLAPGNTATVRYTAVITSTGQFTNVADASCDNLPGLRERREDVNISANAPLRILPESQEVGVGEDGSVTATVENTADTDVATRVQIEADEGLSIVDPAGEDGECRVDEATNTVRCATKTKTGEESTFTLPFSGTQLGTSEVDVTFAGETMTATVNVVEEPSDLKITKTADDPTPPVGAGTIFTEFAITVTSSEDRTVVVSDVFNPAELGYVRPGDLDRDDLSCGEPQSTAGSTKILKCELSLEADVPNTFKLVFDVEQGGEIVNLAEAEGEAADVTINAQALDVEVAVDETEPQIGTGYSYTASVTNTGTEPAPGVVLDVSELSRIYDGMGFVFVSGGTNFHHAVNRPECQFNQESNELECTLGTLARRLPSLS